MVEVEVFVEAVEVGRAVPRGEVMLIDGADVVVQLLHDLGGRRRRLGQSLRGHALVRLGRRSLRHSLQEIQVSYHGNIGKTFFYFLTTVW